MVHSKDNKMTIGVVYGGKSGEHEVSLQTAFAVISAFDFDKYEIIPFFISKQEAGLRAADSLRLLPV